MEKQLKTVTDTSKGSVPLLALAGRLRGVPEAQEAAGQRELVASDVLPAKGVSDDQLRRVGIEVLGAVPGDPLFRYARLPAGWEKVASGHAMWSYLYDGRGRRRAEIFYKASFYDRDARIGLCRRYGVRTTYLPDEARPEVKVVSLADCGVPFREVGRCPEGDYAGWAALCDRADDVLRAEFPDCDDPAAYWGDDG